MVPTTFKLEGEVTSLSESSQGEVGDKREKWGDFWEKSIGINTNMSYYNLCGIGSQLNNISKGKKRGEGYI
jgi:hypothetical protein